MVVALGNENIYEYDHMWNLVREQDNRTEYFMTLTEIFWEVNAQSKEIYFDYDELNRVVATKNQGNSQSYLT